MKTCYACDAAATGKEHVPPKCFFPKDPMYRKDLIKVPSCDEHNSKKSRPDEYLKFVLTACGGVNELAQSIFSGSVMRSFDRGPHLLDKFMPDLQAVERSGGETARFGLDWPQFQFWIRSVVRGLYFHETEKKLTCRITGGSWPAMRTGDNSEAPFAELIHRVECEHQEGYCGANPKVFQYAFGVSKTGNTCFCKLRFYEGQPIIVTWKHNY